MHRMAYFCHHVRLRSSPLLLLLSQLSFIRYFKEYSINRISAMKSDGNLISVSR